LQRTEEDDFQNFVERIENSGEIGYTPYWFGRNFTIADTTFYGPSIPDFGSEFEDGIAFSYDAPLEDGGGSLDVRLYSEAGWERSGAGRPPREVGVVTRPVRLNGRPATLMLIPGGTRPINVIRLVTQIGDTHIVVLAHSGGETSPGGPDSNPLIDEDTFLKLMGRLRPYPE
jgi:hypothetical protein